MTRDEIEQYFRERDERIANETPMERDAREARERDSIEAEVDHAVTDAQPDTRIRCRHRRTK